MPLVYSFGFENVSTSNITDNSGNGHTGVYAGTPTVGPSVVDTTAVDHKNALIFNYDNQNRMEIDDFTFTPAGFTAMAWVYLDPSKGPTFTAGEGGGRWEVIEKGNEWWINIRNDTATKYVVRSGGQYGTGGTATTVDTTVPIQTLTWTHIAVVWNGTVQTTYINGVSRATVNTPGALQANQEKWAWGSKHTQLATPSYLEAFWNGKMDDIRLYDNALTQSEVVTAMNTAVGLTDTTAPSVPTGVTAVSASANQVNISWTASTDDTGVDHYQILRGGTPIGTATGTFYQDTTVTTGSTYTYTVKAIDAANNTSAASSGSTVTVSGVTWTNIAGQTSATHTTVAADVGHLLRCIGSATNSNGTAAYIAGPTAVVTNTTTTPVNTVAPGLSPLTLVAVGTTLTGTMGTWTGTGSYTVKWQRVTGGTTTDISSQLVTAAADQTYVVVAADIGSTIKFMVIGNANADGSGATTNKTTAATNLIPNPVAGGTRSYPPIPSFPIFTGTANTQELTSFPTALPTTAGGAGEDLRAIKCAAKYGNTIFVGGEFSTWADETGATVSNSASLFSVTLTKSAVTGHVGEVTGGTATTWRPNPGAAVQALHVSSDGFLYAGGAFGSIAGANRNKIAKFKLSTSGNPVLDTTFVPPAITGNIFGIAASPDGTIIYIGGQISAVGGTARGYVAALNASDGSLITTFNPNLVRNDGGTLSAEGVRELGFAPGDNTHLYICGRYNQVNGSTTRLALCSVTVDPAGGATDGKVTSWHPDVKGGTDGATGHDMCFMPDGSAIFVAFAGSESASSDGNTTMRWELSPTPTDAHTWRVASDGDNNGCGTDGRLVYIGHHGDGTQSLSSIGNVGGKKITVCRAADGTGVVSGGQTHNVWQPANQFNGVQGTYGFCVTDTELIIVGCWAQPRASIAVFPAVGIV